MSPEGEEGAPRLMAVVDNALGLAFRAFNRLRQANFNMTVNANRIAYVIAQLARGGIACIIAAMVCLAFDVDNHFIHSAGTAQFYLKMWRSEERRVGKYRRVG